MGHSGIYIQNCCPKHPLLGCYLPPLQSVFNIKDPEIAVMLLLFMYTVLLKIKKPKPCSHLKLIMTQNLNIFHIAFAKLDLPHTKYMFLACLQHQAQLTMQ